MSIRLFDIILSLLLIMLFLPVMMLLLILCSFLIEFPPLYISKRVGKNRKNYMHIKFKSMESGIDLGRVFFEQDRINSFGRLLRRLHLDELPELFLILFGKMSFVGPRPLPEKMLNGLYDETRSKVLPGITCLAQLQLQKTRQLDKQLQIRLDNLYVRKKSLGYNCKILIATIRLFISGMSPDLNPSLNEHRVRFKEENN